MFVVFSAKRRFEKTFLIYDVFGKLISENGSLQAMDEGGIKYMRQDLQGSSRVFVC